LGVKNLMVARIAMAVEKQIPRRYRGSDRQKFVFDC
jgi:hypothetical protein